METFEFGDIYIGQPMPLFQLHKKNQLEFMGIEWERIEGYDESESGYVSGIGLYSRISYNIPFIAYRKICKEFKRRYGKANVTEKKSKNYYELHFKGKLLHVTICWRWSEKYGGGIGIDASIKDTYKIHFSQYKDPVIKETIKVKVLDYVKALNKETTEPSSDTIKKERYKTIRAIIIIIGLIIAMLIYAYSSRYVTYKGVVIDKWENTYTPIKERQ